MSRTHQTRLLTLKLCFALTVLGLWIPPSGHVHASNRAVNKPHQAASLSLQSTIWYLTHVDGTVRYYAPQPPYFVPVSYTLNFYGDPLPTPDLTVPITSSTFNLAGSIQCNQMSARYSINDTTAVNHNNALTITLPIVTAMFCITPDDGISQKYLPYLQSTASYLISDTREGPVLYLYDASGQEKLRFANHYVWKPYFLPTLLSRKG